MPRLYVNNPVVNVAGGTVAEFSFTTIQADSGTSPTADSASDTLTLTSSDSSITITGSSTTDTLTLNVSGTNVGGFTEGSVIFADAAGTLAQDNANLFWDDTNNRLGIGDTTPDARLDIVCPTATTTGQIIQAAASQTADLLQLHNSAGTVLAGFYAGGALELGPTGTTPGVGRLSAKGGTAIVTGDVTLGGRWGAGATVTAVRGNDMRGEITVRTSALDTPGLNPTLTLTFKNGTWTTAPFAVTCMNNDTTGTIGAASAKVTATTLILEYDGTPTALTAANYIFNYIVMG